MPTSTVRCLALAVAVLSPVLSSSIADAADRFVDVPGYSVGWRLVPRHSPFAATPEGYAVVAYRDRWDGRLPPVESRVIQVRGATVTTTDFPGWVVHLRSAPNGAHLLVAGTEPDESSKRRQFVSLLGSNGLVRWKREDPRPYHFSTDGSLIWIDDGDGSPWKRSRDGLVLIDLEGKELLTHHQEYTEGSSGPVGGKRQWFAVVGHGDAVVFAGAKELHELEGWSRKQSPWSLDLSSIDTRYPDSLEPFGPDRLLVLRAPASFAIVGTDGTLQHVHDLERVSRSDTKRNAVELMGYQPFQYDAESFLLFDGTPDGLLVDIATGTTTEVVLPTAPPHGYVLRFDPLYGRAPRNGPNYGQLLMLAKDSILIRRWD